MGWLEAEASTQWPGGPAPEQMKRLDEWTEEAPLISKGPGGGNQRGFENYLERANEGMTVAREGAQGDQRHELRRPGDHQGGAGVDHGNGRPDGHYGGAGQAQWPDPLKDIKYFMMQLMADNQSLRKEMQRCVRRVDEIQREAPAAGRTSADQSDKFATPEEKGTPVGGGDQI